MRFAVEAEVHGHHVDGEAWVRPDAQRRRLEWAADGPDHCHGELQVEELSPNCSTITTARVLRPSDASSPNVV